MLLDSRYVFYENVLKVSKRDSVGDYYVRRKLHKWYETDRV